MDDKATSLAEVARRLLEINNTNIAQALREARTPRERAYLHTRKELIDVEVLIAVWIASCRNRESLDKETTIEAFTDMLTTSLGSFVHNSTENPFAALRLAASIAMDVVEGIASSLGNLEVEKIDLSKTAGNA